MNTDYLILAKLGGSSVAAPQEMLALREQRPDHWLTVVSAPGKRFDGDTKVTDLLIAYHSDPLNIDEFKHRIDIYGQGLNLGTNDLHELNFRAQKRLASANTLDQKKAVGEYAAAIGYSLATGDEMLEPTGIIFRQDGTLDRKATYKRLGEQLFAAWRSGRKVVKPGFYGYTAEGEIMTFRRGGSDVTISVCCGVLQSLGITVAHENYTDVDGVMSASPKIVDKPNLLTSLTYAEMSEGARAGNEVLMGESMNHLPGIVTTILNTKNLRAPGTILFDTRIVKEDEGFIAIAGRQDVFAINCQRIGVNDQRNFVQEVVTVLGKAGLSIEHVLSATNGLGFTLNRDDQHPRAQKVSLDSREDLEAGLLPLLLKSKRLRRKDISIEGTGTVSVIGENCANLFTRGRIIADTTGCLSDYGIPVLNTMTATGTPSISYQIPREHVNDAIQLLHTLIERQ